ncbi:hypothetical protein QR98_0059090 [Sarcoptes scabiei]|uniref:Uncharacterized protein n=1 Tax=Sarcoptes scabiei TaxID=52283 RepID=A0A132A8V7_SARSC|nr:hypothetical protein QR98_0059090 [Sarcoptes scabiei]
MPFSVDVILNRRPCLHLIVTKFALESISPFDSMAITWIKICVENGRVKTHDGSSYEDLDDGVDRLR